MINKKKKTSKPKKPRVHIGRILAIIAKCDSEYQVCIDDLIWHIKTKKELIEVIKKYVEL